jgi:hypothetical protein
MGNQQKKFFDRALSPWRGLKKAHKRGQKNIFSNPLMMGIKKTQNFV